MKVNCQDWRISICSSFGVVKYSCTYIIIYMMGLNLKTRESAILYHNKETEPTEYILSYATEEILCFSFRHRIVSFTFTSWKPERLGYLLTSFRLQSYTAPLQCDTIGFRCQFILLLWTSTFCIQYISYFMLLLKSEVGNVKLFSFSFWQNSQLSTSYRLCQWNRIQLHEKTTGDPI